MKENSRYFCNNPLGELIYFRTYSRWLEKKQRREIWPETVDRYMTFMQQHLQKKLSTKLYQEIHTAILHQEIMPSMRLMQFAGRAVNHTHVAAYNCAYIAPTKLKDFAEVMYISMCGTGVGFSVENQNIKKLPKIKSQKHQKTQPIKTHTIKDTKEGWCDALTLGLQVWHQGHDIHFDFSKLRPKGSRLKTFGGKSSGSKPLRKLLTFARKKILQRQGERLTPLDVHDILCKIGECVMAGGVRHSAMISLSDLDDHTLRDAKKDGFYLHESQRMFANNSAVYNNKPSTEIFMQEWLALVKNKSGERGIFNRSGFPKTLPTRRALFLKNKMSALGTNPCGEIILQSKQFCNLTEVICRSNDTPARLMRKISLATILGTYQATLTNFKYLSKEWRDNCEKERLLGVSLTGIWDCPAVRDKKMLQKLKQHSIKVNRYFSKRFGIHPATAITCIKPSGTVSQVVNCASGIHPRYAPYYLRRIRLSATDTLFKMLKAEGIPYQPETGQTEHDTTTYVVEIPVKSPKGSIYQYMLSALDQLNNWKIFKKNYTEHNPSITILVDDHEWLMVANWVYENWDIVGGLSFLPKANHIYPLAPFEAISAQQYKKYIQKFKHIDYAKILLFEHQDETNIKLEPACSAGIC